MIFLGSHRVSSPRAPHQVVIEKEEHEGELMREVESLRKLLETQKGLQHTQERWKVVAAVGCWSVLWW